MMGRFALLLAAVIAASLAGCGEPGKAEPLTLRPPVPPPQFAQPSDTPDLMDLVDKDVPVEAEKSAKFLSEKAADPCPKITVTTSEGEKVKVQLGREGYVTLVVFWSLDLAPARAALVHVGDLVRRYRELRVQAVGIVARTRSAEMAEEVANQLGVPLRLYYDDLSQSALRRLSKEMGAKYPRALPAVFIIDQRLRLRFYRPRFPFVRGPLDPQRPDRIVMEENAPPGQSIRDYLEMILEEG